MAEKVTEIFSKRLRLRQMTTDDFDELAIMLKDPLVMTAWEHAFTDEEVHQWIANNQARYEKDGYGYWIAEERQSGRVVGQIGLLRESIDGEEKMGIGYMLKRDCWGRGYAVEGAKACAQYAFDTLGAPDIICDIRPDNLSSIKVAKSLGMDQVGEFIKQYYGKEMPHNVYQMTAPHPEHSPAREDDGK